MHPGLVVKVSNDFSTDLILDIHRKKITSPQTNKRKCSETIEEVSTKVSKYLVAKKFASIVPPRNDKISRTADKPKMCRKKLTKTGHPKSLKCKTPVNSNLRKIDTKFQNNSEKRMTLEMLIPPLENYRGTNYPFSLDFGSKASHSNNSKIDFLSNHQNNKKKIGKLFEVTGRIITENGTMKYLTEHPTLVCTSPNYVALSKENVANVNSLTNQTHNYLENSLKIPVKNGTRKMLEKELLCDQCPRFFDNNDSLEKHVKCHTAKQYLCSYCPTFLSFDLLENHIKSHTEGMLVKQFLCDKCPTFWYSIENLTSHCNRIHVPKSVISTESSEEFESNEGYVQRVKTCEKSIKTESCGFCSKSFDSENILKIHIQNHCRKNMHKITSNHKNSCTGITGKKIPSILPRKNYYHKKRKRIMYTKTKRYYKKHKEEILTRNSGYSTKNKTSIYEETSEYYRKHGCEEISEFYRKHGQTITKSSENNKKAILEKYSENYNKHKVKNLNTTSECKKNETILKSKSELYCQQIKGQANDEPLLIQIDDTEEDPLLLNSEPELIVIDD